MAVINPFMIEKGQVYVEKSMLVTPDDNMRVIWRAEGDIKHIHMRWKALRTAHNEIWSWLTCAPETLWCYHMRLNGWFCSQRNNFKGDSTIEALIKKEDGTTDVPKDIELYNTLLGE